MHVWLQFHRNSTGLLIFLWVFILLFVDHGKCFMNEVLIKFHLVSFSLQSKLKIIRKCVNISAHKRRISRKFSENPDSQRDP